MLVSGVCSAQTKLKDSLLIFLNTSRQEDTSSINALNKLALYYLETADDSCLLMSEKAITLSRKMNFKKGIAEGYSNIGSFYNGKGEYQTALKNYIESFKLFESIGSKQAMSNAMNSIGNTYLGIKNKDKALESYSKSFEIASSDSNHYMMAIASIGIGNIYIEKNDPKTAMVHFLRSKNIFERSGALYPLSVCYTLIGSALVDMDRFDEAFENFDKAIIQLKKLNNSYGVAGTYELVAAAYEKQGNKNIALDFYLKAYQIFVGRKAYDNLQNVCSHISKIYKEQNKFEQALAYFEQYAQYKDSVFNSENNKQILEVEAKYENEKKQQQIELQNAKLGEQQTRQNALLVGIGVIVLVLVLLFMRYNEKQKSHKALTLANERLEMKNGIIQQKNKAITDSIVYAKRIQSTTMPSEKYIEHHLKRLNR